MSPNARLAVALAAGVTSVFGLWLLLSGGSLSSKTDVDERQRSSAPPAEVEPAREETRHAADAIGEPLREQEQDHDQEQPQEETDAVSDTVEPIPGKWLITGRIVRQAARATSDGFEPVEGARVHLRTHPRRTRPGGALPPRSRIAGADGHFAFGGIPGNLWILVEVDVPPFAYRTLSSELDEPEGAGELRLGEILLEPARTLRIDVVRAAGEPVENADVLVGRPRTQRPETLSNTGFHESRRQAKELGKGSYLLERAPRGLLRIQVLAPGYARFREYVDVGEEEVAFIRLAEGLKIAGLVRTDDGRPVPGASLEVDGPNVGDPPPTTRTDASGRFVFDVLSEGEYSIEVKAEGFVSLRQESITAGVESIAFTLAPESVVAGKVVTDDGERTVADAKVTLRNSTSSELFEAVTDERGVFEVRGLPAGRYFLVVDHEEFAPALGLEIGVREAARLTARTVRLRRGFAISGTVLEAETLKPVPLARVTGQLADATARPRILRSGETGIDGRFELEGFVGGAYLITVTAPDHVPAPPERVTLVPDGKRQFTLLLARGGSISGRVLDRQGKPVVGATLDLRPAPGASAPSPLEQGEQEESVQFVRISQRGTLMSEVTDDQGSYRFSGVPPGREYSLSLYHWKYAPLLVPRFEVGPGKATDDLDLTLRRGAVLRGRVLDERGRGIVSATVKAVLEMKQTARARQVAGALESALRMETHSLMTDSEGNYVISGLRPGTYRVIAKIANRLPYTVTGVDVVEVEVLEVVDIVLEPGESVAGQVVDSHGNPIAGVDIRAHDENSTRAATDLEGRFRLDGLPPGRVAVTAEKTGFVTARVVATAPDDTLLVRMERSATIRGAVVASRSGKPVPGARVILQAAAAPGSPAVRQVMAVTSRTDGTFLLERVPAGRYQLVASHPVHAQVLVPEFSLTAGKTRELLVELPGPLR